MRTLAYFSMSRGGTHAVANWIYQQLPGKTICITSCDIDIPEVVRGTAKHPGGYGLIQTTPEHEVWRNYEGEEEPDNLLFLFEEKDLRCMQVFYRTYDFDDVILNLRDPYNTIASRFQRRENFSYWIFSQYAQQVLEQQDWLQLQDFTNFTYVNFNEWFSNGDHRRALAEQLNLEFTDAGLEDVSNQGAGSSFDGTNMDGNAQNMGVLNRWKVFRQNPEYLWRVLPEVKHYGNLVFGFVPDFSSDD